MKYQYYGRTGDFTQGFLGMTYRNASLSTAVPEQKTYDYGNFGYP
jgi:hypothetical protein